MAASPLCGVLPSPSACLRPLTAAAATAAGAGSHSMGGGAAPSHSRRAASTANAAASSTPNAKASSLSTSSSSSSATGGHPSDARVDAMFYDPAVAAGLTARERSVFQRLEDEPPLPLLADHGFLYNTPASQVASRSPAVQRVLSTRTGDTAAVRSFRRSELQAKFGATPFDTGSSRIQVAMMSERITRMSSHLSANAHDKSCKRQLSLLTVRRRHMMEYMMRRDFQNYVSGEGPPPGGAVARSGVGDDAACLQG